MSNGKGLGILALLIGVSGLGLGIYTLVFPPVQVQEVDTNFGIQETWFSYYFTDVFTDPPATPIVIDPLTINFTVNSGESVYFHYVGMAAVFGAGFSFIQFNFVLDGTIQYHPTGPQVIFGSYGSIQYGSVVLQTTKTISAGFHNLTISIMGTNSSNGVTTNTLLVQTIIP